MRVLMLIVLTLVLSGCYLRGESDETSQKIAERRAVLAELDSKLQQLGGTRADAAHDVVVRVNRPAFEAIVAAVNEAPDRTVTLASTGGPVLLDHDDRQLPLIGHAGWYIELKGGDGKLRGQVQLGKLAIHHDATGLSLAVPVSARLEADTQGHVDPGPGGGFAVSPIDFSATTQETLIATVSALPVENGLGFKVALSSPPEVNASVKASALRLGSKTFNVRFRTAGLTLLEQTVLDRSALKGSLALSRLGLADRAYALELKNASVTSDTDGVQAATALEISWP